MCSRKTKQRVVFEEANGGYYKHFGIHEFTCSLYGDKPEDIIEIEMETADDQTIPPANSGSMIADYWGWYDYDKRDFTMIYAQYFLLNMCFPNGIKAAEDVGQGKAYRLKVINYE